MMTSTARTDPSAFLVDDDLFALFGEKAWDCLEVPMHSITDRLLLGNLFAAQDRNLLRQQGVTHIVCCLGPARVHHPGEFEYYVLEAGDSPEVDISQHFDPVGRWIDAALSAGQENKVLVHCAAGASRSAALVLAYLMRTQQIGAMAALRQVQRIRPIVNPNLGFRGQLLRLEEELLQ